MMKRCISILSFLVIFLIGGVINSFAFCVYNYSDVVVSATQCSGYKNYFVGFKETIDPGKKKCCNWKNKECNKSGKKDQIISFEASYEYVTPDHNAVIERKICVVQFKAGGRLIVKGKKGNYWCETK